jgi:hypothetical protein
MLGRLLTADEYPRHVVDLVHQATQEAGAPLGSELSRLRGWLQRALHLDSRRNFASAIDADRAFDEVLGGIGARRSAAASFRFVMLDIYGQPDVPPGPSSAPSKGTAGPAPQPTSASETTSSRRRPVLDWFWHS